MFLRLHCFNTISKILAKFSQNSACFKTLEATGRSAIAEASPTDKLWGVGLGMKDADLANKHLWKGDNSMGDLLMQVRTELIG